MTNPTARTVLLDLEGTLYASCRLFPGTTDAVQRLRRAGHTVRFLTNKDSRTPAQLVAELAGIGLHVPAGELFTPVTAAEKMLDASPGACVHLLVSHALAPTFARFEAAGPYTHVLVGDCGDVLSYPRLDAAFRALRDGAELVALQRGRYYVRDDGDHLDTGAVVAGLEYAAGLTARLLGKPSTDFFRLAAASAGVPVERCVVVGDDATTDIAGGRAAGARTVQVRTGKYTHAAAVADPPDLTIDSVADLPDVLDGLLAR